MAPVRPEDLNLSSLPRSPLGHLKADAVADLLQRAAWDYREALAHNRQLASTVEELTQQVEERTGQVASLEAAAAQHKDPDELARTLLASVQRTAREERESARRDAELTLKKAARRADRIEDDVARRQAALLSELARLEALKEDVVTRLRGMLETIAGRYADAPDGGVDGRYTDASDGGVERDEAVAPARRKR